MCRKQKDIGLKEFIEGSIKDIFEAVCNLQGDCNDEKLAGFVSPSFETNGSKTCCVGNITRKVTPIHFELEVEAANRYGAGLDADIIRVVSGHTGGTWEHEKSRTQHISFDIDVVLPSIRTKERTRVAPEPSAHEIK